MLKNKKRKIILLNILFIFIFIILTEFCCSLISYNKHLKQIQTSILKNFTTITYLKDYKSQLVEKYYFIFNSFKNVHPKFKKYFDTNKFREVAYSSNDNSTNIILLGCSYTYGSHLTNEQALHSKLSQYTNKNVYNYGIEAGSPKEALYILKNWEYITKKPKNDNVEYVIYTYIDDHVRRLFVNLRPNVPDFKIVGNELKLKKSYFDFYKMNYTYYYASNFLFHKLIYKNANETFVLYLKEMQNEIKKNFSNGDKETKFVLFIYRNGLNIFDDIKNIEIDGITVINLTDILDIDTTETQYKMHDDHPNEKAWEIIVPALVKELNL